VSRATALPVLQARIAERPHVAVAVFAVITAGFTAALGLASTCRSAIPTASPARPTCACPAIIVLLFALDVIPRALWRARGVRRFFPELGTSCARTGACTASAWCWSASSAST
jgi:hypothetical protein